jgi:hypothetical protein
VGVEMKIKEVKAKAKALGLKKPLDYQRQN